MNDLEVPKLVQRLSTRFTAFIRNYLSEIIGTVDQTASDLLLPVKALTYDSTILSSVPVAAVLNEPTRQNLASTHPF